MHALTIESHTHKLLLNLATITAISFTAHHEPLGTAACVRSNGVVTVLGTSVFS